MSTKILSGRDIAERIKGSVKREIGSITHRQKKTLKLVSLQMGESASSDLYLNNQRRLAEEMGVKYRSLVLSKDVTQKSVEKAINKLNLDPTVTGIIIQAPVPRHIDAGALSANVSPEKDVEALHPVNIGRLISEKWEIAPCTAGACMSLIESTGVDLRGKEAVIIGHSGIVGKPLSLMLLSRLATTTVCHIGTYEKGRLREHVSRAEVLIVSVGRPRLIRGPWIRKGAIVIDVGINMVNGKITGDVDFKEAIKRASFITPVPGGVGPVTSAMLMKNLVALHKASNR